MTTTADASKLVSYAVLNENGPDASKLVSYAVLVPTVPLFPSIFASVVPHPRPKAPPPTPLGMPYLLRAIALTYWRFKPTVDDEQEIWFPPRRPAIAPPPTLMAPETFWRFRPTVDDEYPDWQPRKKPVIADTMPNEAAFGRRRRPWTFLEYDDDPQVWYPSPSGTSPVAFPVHFSLDKTIDAFTPLMHVDVLVKFRLDQ